MTGEASSPRAAAVRWPLALAVVLLAAPPAAAGPTPPEPAPAQPLRVTLLGTGNPRPSLDRFGPATLIEAGEHTVLFDAGRGALQRLFQIGGAGAVRAVDRVLLTHLHSDHVVGLPDLWLTGWIFGRDRPLPVLGPPGTREMCAHLDRAFAFDKTVRGDGRYPAAGIVLAAEDVEPGVFYEAGGLRITAFEVDHGDGIVPAYGYRVDYGEHSAVLSGDMRYDERFPAHAEGADLVLMEVISPEVELARAQVKSAEAVAKIIAHHISPEQAGRLFARIAPRLAVYTHIVPSPATAEDLVPPTRESYQGPLAVGYDLMQITVGETVEVHPRRTVVDR